MRILLVEDYADLADTLDRAIKQLPGCEVVWVKSRDSALARLESEHFDLVLLDRRIPTADRVLDDHQDHGWRVFMYVQERLAGMPVWFLTGDEDADFAADLNNDYGRQADFLGSQSPQQMYRVFWKRRLTDCLSAISAVAAQHQEIDRIAIHTDTDAANLLPQERIILRLFARRQGGSALQVTSLNGGLTNSRVLKIVVKNAAGAPIVTAAAKVSRLQVIAAEAANYENVITRLTVGGYTPLTSRIIYGAGDFGGLFYGIVGSDVRSLFTLLQQSAAEAAGVPERLKDIVAPWQLAKTEARIKVAQLRRRLIGDTVLDRVAAELNDIDISQIEEREIAVHTRDQHGDMHCANVLFGGDGRPVLIDFGDAGSGFAGLDAVNLELSTVFHSHSAAVRGGWPTEEAMLSWPDVAKYSATCPFRLFIEGCRSWAVESAASYDEVVACAYAYALRQLKYKDTDKALARALIRGCIEYFTSASS